MTNSYSDRTKQIVFRRVPINLIKHLSNFKTLGYVPENIFNEPSKKWDEARLERWHNQEDGLSVDCNLYTSEEESLVRDNKVREKYGIVKMKVAEVEKIDPLKIKLRPTLDHPILEDNPAHSLIFGITLENKESIRIELARNKVSEWGLRGWN